MKANAAKVILALEAASDVSALLAKTLDSIGTPEQLALFPLFRAGLEKNPNVPLIQFTACMNLHAHVSKIIEEVMAFH